MELEGDGDRAREPQVRQQIPVTLQDLILNLLPVQNLPIHSHSVSAANCHFLTRCPSTPFTTYAVPSPCPTSRAFFGINGEVTHPVSACDFALASVYQCAILTSRLQPSPSHRTVQPDMRFWGSNFWHAGFASTCSIKELTLHRSMT